MRDQNFNLKKQSAENQQKMKEMSTQLAVMTRKLAKIQSQGAGQSVPRGPGVLRGVKEVRSDALDRLCGSSSLSMAIRARSASLRRQSTPSYSSVSADHSRFQHGKQSPTQQ